MAAARRERPLALMIILDGLSPSGVPRAWGADGLKSYRRKEGLDTSIDFGRIFALTDQRRHYRDKSLKTESHAGWEISDVS